MIYIKIPCKIPIRTYHETNTAEEEARTLRLPPAPLSLYAVQ